MSFRRLAAGLATVVVFGLVFVTLGPSQQNKDAKQAKKKKAAALKPVTMSANLVGLEVHLGLGDKQITRWDGEIQISQGTVLEIAIIRGDPKASAKDGKFNVSTIKRLQNEKEFFDGPILNVSLDAPLTATVTVSTEQGKFSFPLSDLSPGTPKSFLDKQATVERADGAIRLTGKETEDDYPVLARTPDGTVWLAYVEYQPGKQPLPERILAGNFDELVPRDNGDQIGLLRFDGKTWHPAGDVTGAGLDIWRPTMVADKKGVLTIAWAQQVEGDWEIFYRRVTPAKDGTLGQLSDIVRVTRSPGSDFNVVAATDSAGVVWLAWQSWRKDNFDIMLTALADNHPWKEPKAVSTSPANDWTPAIAADSRGTVYVAWDTYDKGHYDVRLAAVGKETKITNVADSARFEARPHVLCDDKDRVWIAYEEGDEQWGKDYSTDQFKKIGFDKNPGYALYINRTVKVKCLADGKLVQPAGNVEDAFANLGKRNKSLPRLVQDSAGGVWLFYRQHPLATGAGETWNSFAVRYDGKSWSAPRRLPASAYLLDHKPALVPFAKGILTVYTGDNRNRTLNRDQADLFATMLTAPEPVQAMTFASDTPTPPQGLAPVHPNETADVARIRNYRIDWSGKKLRLLRGEFHRHTEYTAHRDQDGLLEDAWRYALDPGSLDWMGDGDHDNGFHHEYMWWQIQKITDLYQNPPYFIGAHTYERSNVYPNGHRNVIFPKRGIRPLPRGELKGSPEKGTPDTKLLFAYLKHFGGICASHTSGTNMGTDWRDNHPEFEPIVEIYQGHRHNYEHFGAPRSATKDTQIGGYQPAGFVWNAFEKGYRFGFQASSDHVSTHMSYAVVLTDDISRQGIIDAFKRRHCYGATDNIIVDVRSGPQLQGDAFETKNRPTVEIHVLGTAPVAKLSIIKDNRYVYSTEPMKQDVKLTWTDMDAKAGTTSYYYVRIEQSDGNLAWASPMWITYKP